MCLVASRSALSYGAKRKAIKATIAHKNAIVYAYFWKNLRFLAPNKRFYYQGFRKIYIYFEFSCVIASGQK